MKPAPQKYRTTNWKGYNAALTIRGPLLIWLDPAMNWHGQASGKRGRSATFSDETIRFCLSSSACSACRCDRPWAWRKACSGWQAWIGVFPMAANMGPE
jgi:hypothetical protein